MKRRTFFGIIAALPFVRLFKKKEKLPTGILNTGNEPDCIVSTGITKKDIEDLMNSVEPDTKVRAMKIYVDGKEVACSQGSVSISPGGIVYFNKILTVLFMLVSSFAMAQNGSGLETEVYTKDTTIMLKTVQTSELPVTLKSVQDTKANIEKQIQELEAQIQQAQATLQNLKATRDKWFEIEVLVKNEAKKKKE